MGYGPNNSFLFSGVPSWRQIFGRNEQPLDTFVPCCSEIVSDSELIGRIVQCGSIQVDGEVYDEMRSAIEDEPYFSIKNHTDYFREGFGLGDSER